MGMIICPIGVLEDLFKNQNESKSSYEHLGKRKIIFKKILVGDMLVPRRVSKNANHKKNVVESKPGNIQS